MGNWLLPEGFADVLPAEARRIEELRRALLDLYRTYGFELVAPPLVEYLDSLLSDAAGGDDLRLSTCKLVDQLSGRTMGVRADMTPQVTRIDAHLLNRAGVTRLCYCGNVLHARPADLLASRELLQIGAEIYGHAGFEADLEIIRLVLESVEVAGVREPRLDLCHPGVLHALLQSDPAAPALSGAITLLLREKDVPGLGVLAAEGLRPETVQALKTLANLYGGSEVLAQARRVLPAVPGLAESLDALQALVDALPQVAMSVDLADVSGYGYHSGITFALYAEGWHDALVRGGRYDHVSHAFGRHRPATGFSLDLRKLAAGLEPAERARAVRAPWGEDPALAQAVRALRREGHIVVQVLPGHEHDQDEFVCDRELVLEKGAWAIKAI